VRSIMVIEGSALKGIVTQGECAIKVLLPGLTTHIFKFLDVICCAIDTCLSAIFLIRFAYELRSSQVCVQKNTAFAQTKT
jgi:hypothetical protein